MDKYRGMYSDGPAALRLKRLQRLQELGLVDKNVVPHEVVTSQGEPEDWSVLTREEKAKSARAMEAYAGMVDCMDKNIGRVLQYLKKTGQYDDTYVLFMSDNGAEGASYEAMPIVGPDIVAHIDKYYDNSLENIGRHNSFVWYGVRWAQAATAPSRLYKMFSTEGGCRVPLVMKPAQKHNNCAATIADSFCTVMDVVPTILELAGASHPGTEYRGQRVERLRGKSWVSWLDSLNKGGAEAGNSEIHDDQHATGWEVAGSGALRKGRWKITFVPKPKGPQRWELFDIVADRGETKDVSAAHPEVLADMLAAWEEYKKDVGVVGLAGEFECGGQPVDDFEDDGKWIRFLAKDPNVLVQK